MFATVLSVLLMGMLPVLGVAPDQGSLRSLAIAAPLPTTGSSTTLLSLPRELSASGMLVTDLRSGQRILAQHAEERRPIGSLTKIMTALLIAENHAMDEIVTVPADIGNVQGSVAHLAPGSRYAVGELMTAMLVASANDAAQALAQFHSGSVSAFVAEMNERTESLGLRDTVFKTPDGMDQYGQWSTPQDLAWLAQFVFRREEIRSRMALPQAIVTDERGNTMTVENTHALLREASPVFAGKTGTTDAAGQCLLSIVREGQREFVVVLLGSRERYADMRVVLETLATFVI